MAKESAPANAIFVLVGTHLDIVEKY